MKIIKTLSPYQMIVNLSIKKSNTEPKTNGIKQTQFYNHNFEMMKTISRTIGIVLMFLIICDCADTQTEETVAVLNIDTKGIIQDQK